MVRPVDQARLAQERGFDSRLDLVLTLVVAVRLRGAAQSRGAPRLPARGRESGEPQQTFGCDRTHDELASDLELLAERGARGLAVAREQRGQAAVADKDHPHEAILEGSDDRDRAFDVLPR